MKTTVPALLMGALVLSGCADQLGDRGGVGGAAPDFIGDVDIARTCVLGLGFATPSTGNGDLGGATPIIRVAEGDAFCATRAPTPR